MTQDKTEVVDCMLTTSIEDNMKNLSLQYHGETGRIITRQRACSGLPRNIHSLSKETYKTLEEARLACVVRDRDVLVEVQTLTI